MTRRFLLILLLAGSQAHATSFSWHGYVAQGLTQSSGSTFMTDDNNITGELTEIGINGRVEFNQHLALVGQAVYLNGGNRYDEGARLDYLFLDWTLPTLSGWRTHIHLGRYKNRDWLYSSTRDVPQTRSTAVLPQSVYFDGFRDIALGSDGISLQTVHNSQHGSWEFNWSYGRSPISKEQKEAFLGPWAMGKASQDFVHQVSAFWQPPSMNWRLGFSWLESDFTYEAAPTDVLIDGSTDIARYTASLMYFAESWELSAEWLQEHQDDYGAFSPSYQNSRVGEGGYVQWRYLFSPTLSGLVSFDTYVLDRDDQNGKKLQAQSGGQIPAYFGYMDTVAIGARWDFAPNWRLQAEHHWVEGAARTNGLLNPQMHRQTERNWQMWAVQLMYWF